MANPFKKLFKKSPSSAFKNIGAPGTAIYGGYIQEIEKSSALMGREKYRTYSDILANTSIVAAGTRYFLNLLAKSTWKVQPADDSAEAVAIAEKIEMIMDSMDTPWHRVIRRAGMYRFYGFSMQEWTAKKLPDGTIGYADIAPRPQITIERWETDDAGRVTGVVQRSPQDSQDIYIPRGKLIYIVDDTINDSPEGLGLFRHIVQDSKTLARFEQLEAFGYETDLRGVPIGKAPYAELQKLVEGGEISQADADAIVKPLQDFISNHIKSPSLGLILDSITYQSEDDASTPSIVPQWGIELMRTSAGNNTEAAIANAIERLNQNIARVLGIEGLLLGSTNYGSQALSSDKSHSFALIVDGTLKELTESFRKDFLDPIFELNGWDPNLKPRFKTDANQYRDITKITEALKDMAAAGAPLPVNDPAINEIRSLLGLSDQIEDPEYLDDGQLLDEKDPRASIDEMIEPAKEEEPAKEMDEEDKDA